MNTRCVTIPLSGAISGAAWLAVAALATWASFGGSEVVRLWAMLAGVAAATWTVTTVITAAMARSRAILTQTIGYQIQMRDEEERIGDLRSIR